MESEAKRLDSQFLSGISNWQDWLERRPKVYQEYMESLGLWPLPVRTPLQATVTRVLNRDEGFRVENVHFQSLPKLYVTGNLYLPKEAAPGDKLPAVLYVCGHSGRGRDGNKTAFQQHGMWFATHGYACLIVDTLQLGEIAAIHHGTYRHNRWWWQARGYTPAAVECWNGVRALDYLQSRPEIDPSRLAVTGISGGGAATFWIAAADERVKVAVPVSGMSDLEDYVGGRVVNGHCDCMFCINPFQRSWTDIAALVAPRPMLFANSGHDTIFPMSGNDRIRARLERLYGLYTNRTDLMFDIGVTPGGHDDKVELRLMAYRWINRHLKGQDVPVTEPVLPPFEGAQLRAFPDALPADERNTSIDQTFIPMAVREEWNDVPTFNAWRQNKLQELRRLVLGSVTQPSAITSSGLLHDPQTTGSGWLPTEAGIEIPWRYFPGKNQKPDDDIWLVVLGEAESSESRPDWFDATIGDAACLIVSPRGSGPLRFQDPPPFFIQRALPLLGRTLDTCRLIDVLHAVAAVANSDWGRRRPLKIAGKGAAGILGAYAGILETRLTEVIIEDPPSSHVSGPIFPNILRVVDIPDALALLAPRSLRLGSSNPDAFSQTARAYKITGGSYELRQR